MSEADAASTSIILADDHAVVRKGLRLLIDAQPGLHVIAEAGTVPDAGMKARALHAGVLILDLNMRAARASRRYPRSARRLRRPPSSC
jgi:two-component system, NarL family, response regulator NreC